MLSSLTSRDKDVSLNSMVKCQFTIEEDKEYLDFHQSFITEAAKLDDAIKQSEDLPI